MALKWDPPALWAGETVIVMGCGPSMTRSAADAAERSGHRLLAINHAIRYVPDCADAVLSLDPDPTVWMLVPHNFKGLKIIGADVAEVAGHRNLLFLGVHYETVACDGGKLDFRNSTLSGLRMSSRLGAKEILLLGIDPTGYEALRARQSRYGFIQGYEQIVAELAAAGTKVRCVA